MQAIIAMGRTTRWFRSLIGGKKEAKQETPLPSPKETTVDEPWDVQKKTTKEKRRWSFRRSVKDQSHEPMPSIVEHRPSSLENFISEPENEQSMHAIAVAAATAATADAAVAAAQAAAVVVRLTSNGCSFGCGGLGREEGAAIRIQTAFRGYLARRALCALKSLVKLQALIRGHIVRKQAAATLRCMQALVRIQARVRARRVRMSEEGQAVQRQLIRRRQQEPRPRKSTEGWNASTHSVEDQEAKVQKRQAATMKRERALAYAFSQQEIERRLDESAKIVEMDTGRPKTSSNNRICSISEFESAEPSIPSITSATRYSLYDSVRQSLQLARSPPQIEGQLASPLMVSPAGSECVAASALQGFSPKALNRQCEDGEDSTFSTAQSSPQYFSAVSKAEVKRGPLTPYRPEYANNFFQDYSAFPNYMANTESSKAKVRSQSAPKQRPDSYEKTALPAKKRMPSQGAGENWSSLSGVRMQRSSSQVGTTCKSYLYAASIRLDRSTMSLRDSEFDKAPMFNKNYQRPLVPFEPCSSKRY